MSIILKAFEFTGIRNSREIIGIKLISMFSFIIISFYISGFILYYYNMKHKRGHQVPKKCIYVYATI